MQFPVERQCTVQARDLGKIQKVMGESGLRFVHNPIIFKETAHIWIGGNVENFQYYDSVYSQLHETPKIEKDKEKLLMFLFLLALAIPILIVLFLKYLV